MRPAEQSPATNSTGIGGLKAGLQNFTYSLVIPAYNEGARLAPTLVRVLGYIARQGCDAEVIVVNDGSRDNTADIVRSFAQGHPSLRLAENPWNRGTRYSARNGVLHSRGRVVF